ncbi:TIR domain-containing protein [Longimicrobium sp.]|uniref:TIR domain-containing protein n=1 Tax=Longimicrobium sp. TaxID=2029185 RepID=UPI002E332FE9|nr:TIR domain-containing protein [Longimicrobium sp.]HEX6041068.1 TIR domain-containing protein [Longimicrobium sp.]
MAKRIFLSHSFVDRALLNDLLQFFQARGGPVMATPTYMRTDLGEAGPERIRQAIREQMQGCAGVLLLVGDEAHNSRWIQYEMGVANELRIPKYRLQHPARTGGPPVAHAGMHEIPWSPREVAAVLNPL